MGSQLQKDFNTLQVMVTEKEEELSVLTQDAEEQELLKHEIDQLHQSLSEKEKQQSAQQHSLSVLKKEIASLQQQAKGTSTDLSLLKESLESKSSQMESWQRTAQEHKLRADQLKQSLDLLSVEQGAQTKSAEALRQSLEQEVCRLQAEVAEQANDFQRELEKRQQEVNRLETERDGLKKALESTNKKLEERESQAQKSRRAMELKTLREQRANQERLIQHVQREHAEKQSDAENQIQTLLAKLQDSKEKQEMDRKLHKDTMRTLTDGHQQELLAFAKDKSALETSQQVSALREEVQRLKQQLLAERHHSQQFLQSRESTPDSDATTMSSSCNSTGAEEGLQLLPHNIQKLCSRLLKEGKEVLSLTESQQKMVAVVPSATNQVELVDAPVQYSPLVPEMESVATQHDHGDGGTLPCTDAKETQCNLMALSVTISESLLIAKEKLIEEAEWIKRLVVTNSVSSKEDLVELIKSLFTLERQWLLKQIEGVLVNIASFTEPTFALGQAFPANSDQLLTRTWWKNRTDLLIEKHTALVNQLISSFSSITSTSLSEQKVQRPIAHNSPEMLLLMEQLESCRWQIQKQKELLDYNQQHEESQRQEFQNHLEQEKVNSNQLSSQLREWRKRCSLAENNLSAKQNEVTKLAQALDKALRDLDHSRGDLDLEKFHGQQLVHALESERRNFRQIHAALYSERQRMHAAQKKNVQTIQHLTSVLHANGLGDKMSPLAAASSFPSPVETPEFLRHASSLHSVNNSLNSYGMPASASMECMNCSLREHQNALLSQKGQALEMPLEPDTSDSTFHESVHMEVVRLRRHRDSLSYQKRYLLRLLCNYQASEAVSLSVLDRMGVCTPPPTGDSQTVGSSRRRCSSFRAVSFAVLSAIRFTNMARVLKELRNRQGFPYEGFANGRQRWRHRLTPSQNSLVPSPPSSSSAQQVATSSVGSSRNGVRSSSWYAQGSAALKSSQNSSNSSQHFSENNSDSFSMKALCSEKSGSEQRSISDKRFEDCVERLEYLHQRMGLDTC